MSKMKLKTDKPELFGTKLNIPVDGEISISKSGIVIVSEEAASFLINNHDGSFYNPDEEVEDDQKDDASDDNKENEDNGGQDDNSDDTDDENEDEEEDESDNEDEDETTDLNTLELDELIQLAKDAGIKEPSYRKFKNDKDGMVKFLSEKLSD